MGEIYNRIKEGKPFDEDFNLYNKLDLTLELKMLEQEEEYEKCAELLKYINTRFEHDGFYTEQKYITI